MDIRKKAGFMVCFSFVTGLSSSCTNSGHNTKVIKAYDIIDEHPGTENYKVVKIIPKGFNSYRLQQDTISEYIYINRGEEKEQFYRYKLLKIDIYGNPIDTYPNYNLMPDGTICESEYYSTWAIDKDSDKYYYSTYNYSKTQNKLTQFKQDFEMLYSKASSVYRDYNNYFFKVNGIWFRQTDELNVMDDAFRNAYPTKDSVVRMVFLKDITTHFFTKPHLKKSTLLNAIGYESEYQDKAWYLTVFMPLGDTVKIKWAGGTEESPELLLYKIPKKEGGRYDVLFIRSIENYGMYSIRPRDTLQPEYRYENVKFDSKDGKKIMTHYNESKLYLDWVATKK